MKDEFVKSIGIWGQRHYNYLKRNSPTVINAMRMKGTLEQYLQDVDRDAEKMFSQLIKQLAERDGITEALKATDQMLWVQHHSSCCTLISLALWLRIIYFFLKITNLLAT